MSGASESVEAGGKPPIPVGIYGLQLPDIGPEVHQFANVAPTTWPEWTVSYSAATRPNPTLNWDADLAVLPLAPSGVSVIRRADRHTMLVGVSPDDHALLHPHFGATALAHATWSGRLALHGGVLSTPSGSWGLLGEREAGKSSALAWWIRRGAGVVADDLVVTDAQSVFAGPRFVDLRESAHEHFGLGVDAGVLGTRRRWRQPLDPIAAETPFAGLVELAWGERISVDVVSMVERVELLRRHRGLQLPIDVARQAVLHVLTKPILRFTRPRSWLSMDDAMQHLRDVLVAY